MRGEGAAPPPQCKPSIDSIWGKHRVVWFWLLGLLVACFFDGWMDGCSVNNMVGGDGRMHGCTINGWSVNECGRGCGGGWMVC